MIDEVNIPDGWEFSSVSCVDSDGDSVGTAANEGISVAVASGTTVCTFINEGEPDPAVLTVTKETNVVTTTQFTVEVSGTTQTIDTSTPYTTPVASGTTIAVSETISTLPDDWSLTSIVCTNATAGSSTNVSDPSALSLQDGDAVTCVVTNEYMAPPTPLGSIGDMVTNADTNVGLDGVTVNLVGPGVMSTTMTAGGCLLYTSPSPRDLSTSRMPSSA